MFMYLFSGVLLILSIYLGFKLFKIKCANCPQCSKKVRVVQSALSEKAKESDDRLEKMKIAYRLDYERRCKFHEDDYKRSLLELNKSTI